MLGLIIIKMFIYIKTKGPITRPLTEAMMSGPLTTALNTLSTQKLPRYYTTVLKAIDNSRQLRFRGHRVRMLSNDSEEITCALWLSRLILNLIKRGNGRTTGCKSKKKEGAMVLFSRS